MAFGADLHPFGSQLAYVSSGTGNPSVANECASESDHEEAAAEAKMTESELRGVSAPG